MIETKLNIKKKAIEVYEDGELIKIFLLKYKSKKVGIHYIDVIYPVLKETDKVKLISKMKYSNMEIIATSINGDEVVCQNATQTDWEIISGVFYKKIFENVMIVLFCIFMIYISLDVIFR